MLYFLLAVVCLIVMRSEAFLPLRTAASSTSLLKATTKDGGEVFTKSDVINGLAEKLTISKADAARFLTGYEELISELVLDKKGEVRMKGFGTWKVKQLKARMARNPHTGGTVQSSEKHKLSFAAAKNMTQVIGENGEVSTEKETEKAPAKKAAPKTAKK